MVEVVTAEVRITVGSLYLKYAVTQLQNGYIVRTATAVEDNYLHVFVRLVKTVSQGGCCRLVHDTANGQAGNLTSFLRSLTLAIVEVGRYRDNGFSYFLTKIILSGLLHFLKDDSRDFLRSIQTSVDIHTRSVVVTLNYFIRHACNLA